MEVSEERLRHDVLKLTKSKPARNYKNVKVLNQVAQYIHLEMKSLNCNVENQDYVVNGSVYSNVIASFGPEEGERLIVGAHYDVAGDQPGADDNASGVAGLLEIGRMLHKTPHIKHRIDLVFYSLEEPPFFATEKMGSAFHARYISDNHISVKAMICLDMIGYFSEQPNTQGFPSELLKQYYPDRGNFVIVVGKQGQEEMTMKIKELMAENSLIDVQSINLPLSEVLVGLSDHRNYWNYGYQAVMINDTAFLRNPHYHRATDVIDTLDFGKMTEVVRGVYGAILSL